MSSTLQTSINVPTIEQQSKDELAPQVQTTCRSLFTREVTAKPAATTVSNSGNRSITVSNSGNRSMGC